MGPRLALSPGVLACGSLRMKVPSFSINVLTLQNFNCFRFKLSNYIKNESFLGSTSLLAGEEPLSLYEGLSSELSTGKLGPLGSTRSRRLLSKALLQRRSCEFLGRAALKVYKLWGGGAANSTRVAHIECMYGWEPLQPSAQSFQTV